MAPLPAPLQEYITSITPSLRLLLVGAVWSAALVPLFILLFFLSTPTVRRKPIFFLNVFTVTMGIVIGIINTTLCKTLIAYIGMIILMPIIMDCILAYRLMAVYPRQTTSNLLLEIIFIPIALFKIARITNIIIFLVVFSDTLLKHGQGSSAVPEFQNLWNHAPYPKVEWIFQVIDNLSVFCRISSSLH
ncbi:hypothetical protein F5890DRAFT_1418225 [Lentinula detonsa]|uniref:Uncharacterized protein n=1 Tax=Lentinula detonsa TaxID=2804962 RepID=A0AA38PT14_9AGAR|nr:hypothetical protein F5890DRAFT_1418225 [Lentinula detonsa]